MIPGRARRWLPALIEAAKSHPSKRGSRHAAMLVKGNRVIIGINSNAGRRWLRQRGYWSTHAEASVFHNVGREGIEGADLVVIRVTKNGKLANSKPCEECQALVRHFGVRRVVYTNEVGEWERL